MNIDMNMIHRFLKASAALSKSLGDDEIEALNCSKEAAHIISFAVRDVAMFAEVIGKMEVSFATPQTKKTRSE